MSPSPQTLLLLLWSNLHNLSIPPRTQVDWYLNVLFRKWKKSSTWSYHLNTNAFPPFLRFLVHCAIAQTGFLLHLLHSWFLYHSGHLFLEFLPKDSTQVVPSESLNPPIFLYFQLILCRYKYAIILKWPIYVAIPSSLKLAWKILEDKDHVCLLHTASAHK